MPRAVHRNPRRQPRASRRRGLPPADSVVPSAILVLPLHRPHSRGAVTALAREGGGRGLVRGGARAGLGDGRGGPMRRPPTPMLRWLRRGAGVATPVRPPVAVFGLSFLARAQLEALTDLAATSEVTVYVL